MDPFDDLPFSPRFQRAPIEENQRYSFPGLARSPRFDSAVVGTSTSRLLRPEQLDRLFGARFVNLAMNSSVAWEQYRILGVFLDHHPAPRVVVMGLDDDRWLAPGTTLPHSVPEYPFPEWLFDDDPWNDLPHMFDTWTLERARRQLVVLLGMRRPTYGYDGYRSFLPDFGTYDLEKAERLLHATPQRGGEPRDPPIDLSEAERRRLVYPADALLERILARLPTPTELVLFFPPYHHLHLPAEGSHAAAVLEEGKRRVADLARGRPRTRVVDFMISSPITERDQNFWDPVHPTEEVAARVDQSLRASRDAAVGDDGYVRRVP